MDDFFLEHYLVTGFRDEDHPYRKRDLNREHDCVELSSAEFLLRKFFLRDPAGIVKYDAKNYVEYDFAKQFLKTVVIDDQKLLVNECRRAICPSLAKDVLKIPIQRAQKNPIADFPLLAYFAYTHFHGYDLLAAAKKVITDHGQADISLDDIVSWTPFWGIPYSCNLDIFHSLGGIPLGLLFFNAESPKITVPFFRLKKKNVWYCFIPSFLERYFFNELQLIEHPEAVVILTDSFAIATRNQYFFGAYLLDDMIWLSWYTRDPENLPENLPWEKLKGRTVYYLLRRHSGLSNAQIMGTAYQVAEKLKRYGIAMRYLNCLFGRPYDFSTVSPMQRGGCVMSQEELDQWRNDHIRFPDYQTFKTICNNVDDATMPLITPVFFHQSVILIPTNPGLKAIPRSILLGRVIGKDILKDFRGSASGVQLAYFCGISPWNRHTAKVNMELTEKIVLGKSPTAPEQHSSLLDQMRPPLNSAFPRERLAWQYIDMSHCPSPELLCNDIRVRLQTINFYGNAPKILALEDVLYPSQNGYGLYNELLLQLRRAGWTVVIIDSGITTGQKLSPSKLLHNSMVTVKPKTKECISILIRDIEDKVKEVHCQLDTEKGRLVSKLAPKPTRSTLLNKKLSLDKLVSEVQFRTRRGETGQHIADCLKISLNQVKVLRRFLQKKGALVKRSYNRKSPNGKVQWPENKPIELNTSLRAEDPDNCPFTPEFWKARAKDVTDAYSGESAITSYAVADPPKGLSQEEGASSDENGDAGRMPPDTPDPESK